jgi:hypothetical protein
MSSRTTVQRPAAQTGIPSPTGNERSNGRRPGHTLPALRATLLALVAFGAVSTHAATTTSVVDIPAVDGGTQRFLQVRPDAPIAYVVVLPGGNGNLGIQNNGSVSTRTGTCNPFGRNADAFAGRRIGLPLIDMTSNGSIYNHENVFAVVRKVRERDNVPIWLAGGSASTDAIGFAARMVPTEIPAGVIFYSPGPPDSNVALIRRPAVVIAHPLDPFQSAFAMSQALTAAPVHENLAVTGGNDAGCGYHLFNGADAEFVNVTSGAIERNNAATAGTPAVNLQGVGGTWYNPATPGQGFMLEAVPSLNSLVLGWFTWSNTAGDHFWLSGIGPVTGNSASIELVRSANGRFNDPTPVSDDSIGTATFRFTDCSHATVSFQRTDTGESGTIPIQRLTPVPSACTAPTLQ